jgi:DNA polymerase-3 subunit delta'
MLGAGMEPSAEQRIRAQLEGALERDAVTGAYLFEGAHGSGPLRTAVWLAGRLLGRVAGFELDEQHPAARPGHPDLHWVAPESGWIRVDVIRRMQVALSLVANEGGRRVAVIEDAQSLRVEAANALLKTLEEPPRGALLLLIATRATGLPATLRSRVVRFRFPAWSESGLREQMEAEGLSRDDAWLASALGGASPETARLWAEASLDEAREMSTWLSEIGSVSASEILDFAETFRGGERARTRADLLIDVYEAIARRESETAAGNGDLGAVARWTQRFEATEHARQEMQRRNLNPQLVVEGLLLDLRTGA